MLSQEEKTKLRQIVGQKSLDTTPAEWNILLEERGIRRMGRITHICAPPELGEVRVDDAFGSYLAMTEDAARKILVLGM